MKEINILTTRSFWATAASIATAVEQAGSDGGANYTGILTAAGTLLEAAGAVPSGAEFAGTFGPLVTASLGLWAYVERIRGTKTVVLGRALK